jgi:hypothetical protein
MRAHLDKNAPHENNESRKIWKKIHILKTFNMNVNFHNFCINTFGIYEQISSFDKDKKNMERADFRMQIMSLQLKEKFPPKKNFHVLT